MSFKYYLIFIGALSIGPFLMDALCHYLVWVEVIKFAPPSMGVFIFKAIVIPVIVLTACFYLIGKILKFNQKS